MKMNVLFLLTSLALPLSSWAEVVGSAEDGFSVSHSLITPAPAEAVWSAMTQNIDQWWHPDHSWSADAANLYMDARLGGCFCERLPATGGSVEHLRIIYFNPNREIRFDGALGPLQGMATSGRMIWTIEATEEGSAITFTYKVHGWSEGGLAGIAPAVDGVIGQQLERLGSYLAVD